MHFATRTRAIVRTVQRGVLVFVGLLAAHICAAQTPSASQREEISDLVTVAAEKLTNFEEAVRQAKDYLDTEGATKISERYLADAAALQVLAHNIETDGPSAYLLVQFDIALDNVRLDIAHANMQLMQRTVSSSQSFPDTYSDVTELLRAVTLRYLRALEPGGEQVYGKQAQHGAPEKETVHEQTLPEREQTESKENRVPQSPEHVANPDN